MHKHFIVTGIPANPITSVDTTKKLSKLAGVGKETYRMDAKILNSDNEKLKQEVLSGKKRINTESKSSAKKVSTFNNDMPET